MSDVSYYVAFESTDENIGTIVKSSDGTYGFFPNINYPKSLTYPVLKRIGEILIDIATENASSNMMMSLFDYLGHPAGDKLGKAVAKQAEIEQEPYQTRHVKTKSYEGDIMLYRKQFLDKFFS
jgi:hypothetical protein